MQLNSIFPRASGRIVSVKLVWIRGNPGCNSLTEDPDKRGYLMSKMFPSMVVGGFVTVTITSVIFAGYFAQLLGGGGVTF